tara:strand:+ start:238 stop:1005 length:768 start_codon:yes stop_codon:yes gene_type:complete
MNTKPVRINKYLSEVGFCSRREADRLLEDGRITINGSTPEMGTKVLPTDIVCVDGKEISPPQKEPVYIAYNKPIGIICTTDQRIEGNIIAHVNYPTRIFHVGRLDKPSQGLILLTDDGDIVNRILRARFNHEKEYLVKVHKSITKSFLREMRNGVPILDTVTRKCKVDKLSDKQFRIVLTQGLNRQIRRMCEHLGYAVTKLQRVRIMNIHLDIPVGTWRHLRKKELTDLKALLDQSEQQYSKQQYKEAQQNTSKR